MVIDKTGRSLMRSGFGVMHATNRFRLLAIVSVVVAGCSSSKSPPPVERDACLAAGPAKSVDYDNCVANRERKSRAALEALLDDKFVYPPQQQIVEASESKYQPSDFPESPAPMIYKGLDSISLTEKRALPFKIRIVWKYTSTGVIPERRDAIRMAEMEKLIVPAVEEKRLAKWVCTVTGGHQREWIFYTQNDEAFTARTRSALSQGGPYPIELSARRDVVLSTGSQPADNLAEVIRITPKKCVE
ncbi:DUF695 domain-containing protein [Pseudomonas chlororaphis]|uniref:DUF695 domain-containing protein n=1 Tax=Pseudomonas chlororaphis TaxID=587753 RepID=UPI0035D41C8B